MCVIHFDAVAEVVHDVCAVRESPAVDNTDVGNDQAWRRIDIDQGRGSAVHGSPFLGAVGKRLHYGVGRRACPLSPLELDAEAHTLVAPYYRHLKRDGASLERRAQISIWQSICDHNVRHHRAHKVIADAGVRGVITQ
ncbi:MAG: hypothetical protein [Bacteriophage sp.]|nr:MAG: hypothetical protein [Bacteriophage sp.]